MNEYYAPIVIVAHSIETLARETDINKIDILESLNGVCLSEEEIGMVKEYFTNECDV